MADNVIQIIINATDNASGVIKGVGGGLGGLAEIATGALAAGLAVAAAGFAGLAAGIGLSIKEAMDAEVINARVEQVIRSTGGAAGVTGQQVDELAMQFRDLAGGSDDAVKSAEAVLLRFTNISRNQFPEATETALNLASVLKVDTASAALMLGKALEEPGVGLMRLRAAGVVFTAEQTKMIKALTDSGQVAEAQKYILDALAKTTGGAAAAMADTLGGRLEILKGHLLEVAEGVGNRLLPMLEEGMGKIEEVVDKVAGRFQPFLNLISSGVDPVSAFRTAFGDLLPPAVQDVLDAIVPKFTLLLDSFRLFPGDIAGAIANFFYGIGEDAIGDAIVNISTALTGVFEALRTVATGDFRGGIFGLQEDDPAVTVLLTIHDLVANQLPTAISGLSGMTLGDIVPPDVAAAIQNLFDALGSSGPQVQTSMGQIQTSTQQMGASLTDTFSKVSAVISGPALSDSVSGVANLLNSLAGFWREHGDQIIAVITTISTAESSMMTTGLNMAIGIIGGLLAIITGTFKATTQIIQGDWGGAFQTLSDTANNALNAVLIGAGTSLGQLQTVIAEKLNGAIAWLRTKVADLVAVGKELMAGFVVGIEQGALGLIAAMVNAVNNAIQAAKDAANIHSPSEATAELGDYLMQGMGVGVGRSAYIPASAMAGAMYGTVSSNTTTISAPVTVQARDALDAELITRRVVQRIQEMQRP